MFWLISLGRKASGSAGPCVTTLELESASREKGIDVPMIQGVAAISYAGTRRTTSSVRISLKLFRDQPALIQWAHLCCLIK